MARDHRWIFVRQAGRALRRLAEGFETQQPLDDFAAELKQAAEEIDAITYWVAEIKKDFSAARSVKVNREMLREAWRTVWNRHGGEGDLFSKFEAEIFGEKND